MSWRVRLAATVSLKLAEPFLADRLKCILRLGPFFALLILADLNRIVALRQGLTGGCPYGPGFGERQVGIVPERQSFLPAPEAVIKSPEPSTCRHDEQAKP